MSANLIHFPTVYGAAPQDWTHFTLVLGLTADLLPVVSNPSAEIDAESKMKDLGKVPSRYNGEHKAVGFAKWTQHTTTEAEVAKWSRQRDYGICLQTRHIRALDVDITDEREAGLVSNLISDRLAQFLPKRYRSNASKFLLAFRLEGEMPKRVIRTAHGIIEFLANGQQFIAVGTHPSGVRYEWEGGLPDDFPTLTLEQFEALWSMLVARFAVEPPVEGKTATKAQHLADAAAADPVGKYLLDNAWVKSTERDGRLHIRCPFEDTHSEPGGADSATSYFPAHTGGYVNGHFRCLHAHCEHRTDAEFKEAIGIPSDDFADFDVVEDEAEPGEEKAEKPLRYQFLQAADFSVRRSVEWIIKGVLPQEKMGVVYGASGSGKSFLVTDMAMHVAQGLEWRGRRVKQGSIAYICAEGAGGFQNRLRAHAEHQGIDLATLPFHILGDSPNFLEKADVKDLLKALRVLGPLSLIVVDTFAQVIPGGNENSGEHVGLALQHAGVLHKHTGAMVLIVHHAGKDVDRGARGWSGLRAAADAEISITRNEEDRVASVTKLKDGVDGLDFAFKLNVVNIGMDEDQEPITSCVVEHTEMIPKGARKGQPKGAVERTVLRLATDMVGLSGEEVKVIDLINTAINELPHDDGKRDRRREVVLRAIEALVGANRITTTDNVVTLL